MSKPFIFIEENNHYQFDFSQATWATDRLNEIFHECGLSDLSDVDFIAELPNEIIFLEYKNASIPESVSHENYRKPFNPFQDKKLNNIIRKFYDSYIYLTGQNKIKPVKYVYILEYPHSDSVMRGEIRNRLVKRLPFKLQKLPEIENKLIDSLEVLSIEEWNQHQVYHQFPITLIT